MRMLVHNENRAFVARIKSFTISSIKPIKQLAIMIPNDCAIDLAVKYFIRYSISTITMG